MIRRSAFALALALATCPLWAMTYTLEPNHSMGTVRWGHLDFAYPTAQFTRVEGTLEFDPAEPTRMDSCAGALVLATRPRRPKAYSPVYATTASMYVAVAAVTRPSDS